jgi:WD40 repeat protein
MTMTQERDGKKNQTVQQVSEASAESGIIENKLLNKNSKGEEKRNWQNVNLVRKIDNAHDGAVWCLKVVDEKRIISSAGGDMTIKIWDRESWLCLQTLKGHTHGVWSLKRLGQSELISGSGDNTIKLWDLTENMCVQTLRGHTGPVCCVKLLSNGDIVSASWDKTIRVWNIEQGKCIKTLKGHASGVFCLKVLDNEDIVSGSGDKTLKVWDLWQNQCVRTLTGHTDAVYCVKRLGSGICFCCCKILPYFLAASRIA